MYQINFQKPIHVHFIGIGGISMSALAEILLNQKFTISGSDSTPSDLTAHLEACGASIAIGQRAENITPGIDLVVYTAAIAPENPEFRAAKSAGIPMLSRADLLGQIMKNYATPVAISGTHGKTTTTSMIADVLQRADADPTVTVGGILDSINGNLRIGNSDVFVTEACEYKDSFLSFFPKIAIILNVEEDHLDYFPDLAAIRRSFRRFAEKLPADGLLIINGSIDNLGELTDGLSCKVVTYGLTGSENYTAKAITYNEDACGSYELYQDGACVGRVSLAVPGEHNVSNSLAAIAALTAIGLPFTTISEGLCAFCGTERRFEKKGDLHGIAVYDDYAHHPSEIRATLKTARLRTKKKCHVVFQPHTYSRTKAFLKDFARALSLADDVVLAKIYAAREPFDSSISAADIKRELDALGTDCTCTYLESFDAIETYLLEACEEGDLLLTMGAGDVYKIGEDLLGER